MPIIPAFIHRRIAHRHNLVKIVDNIGWLFFDKVLRMSVGLIVGVWIARYLGPEQFGLLSFATAFVGLFGAIATLGLQGIVVRDIVRDPTVREETLGTAAALHFIGGLMVYGLILATIFWLRADDPLAKAIVAILGSMMLFKVSQVAVYWFESQVMSKYTVWVQNGVFLVFAAVKVGLILQNAPMTAFAWAMMAEALVVAILLLVILGLRGPQLRRLRVTAKRGVSLLKDSWPLMLASVAVLIYMKIDQIMLGQMIGDQAVGVYSAAVRVSEVFYFIPIVIVASLFPAIIEAKKHDETLYLARLKNLYGLMVLLSLAIAVPLAAISTPLIVQVFGAAYQDAGLVLAIHVWAIVFVSLNLASGKWFIVENRQIWLFQRHLLGAGINVALNLALIPDFGINGAALATLVSYMFAGFFYDLIRADTRVMFIMKVEAMKIYPFVSNWIRR
jgi:O-antigen/teichoic acid export membrane protein